ncbi:MAG: methyltransferase domain-containing protein [Candidatus Hydrogenedentes bacterium]|nr:methyltransferase domain-containing protein [Candidatus Hydrogenedentota bacterium]
MARVEITSIANGGYGIGRYNGKVIFIPFSYPGDIVEVSISYEKKNYIWGNIQEIVTPSKFRISPLCPYMGICGGCMWGCVDYTSQIMWKKSLVESTFQNFLNYLHEINISIDETSIYNYRTRVKLHSNGKTLGFYKFHSHDVVEVSKCILLHEKIIKITNEIKNIPRLAEIILTVNPFGEESLIYTNIKIQTIKNKYKEIYNYKNDFASRKYFLVDGVPIVNGSFSQNSLILNKLLINKVREYLNCKNGKVLDLYCGSGNLTINLPSSSFEITGVDIDPFAIELARKYSSFDYKVGSELLMKKIILDSNWDAIILDPPREGAKNLIEALKLACTKKIIYVSCNYITQCRDLKPLLMGGWKLEKVSIVDLFPHTPHIETVVLLTR